MGSEDERASLPVAQDGHGRFERLPRGEGFPLCIDPAEHLLELFQVEDFLAVVGEQHVVWLKAAAQTFGKLDLGDQYALGRP